MNGFERAGEVDRLSIDWARVGLNRWHLAKMTRAGKPRHELEQSEYERFERYEADAFVYDMASMLVRGPYFAVSLRALARGTGLLCDHEPLVARRADGEERCTCAVTMELVEALIAQVPW